MSLTPCYCLYSSPGTEGGENKTQKGETELANEVKRRHTGREKQLINFLFWQKDFCCLRASFCCGRQRQLLQMTKGSSCSVASALLPEIFSRDFNLGNQREREVQHNGSSPLFPFVEARKQTKGPSSSPTVYFFPCPLSLFLPPPPTTKNLPTTQPT